MKLSYLNSQMTLPKLTNYIYSFNTHCPSVTIAISVFSSWISCAQIFSKQSSSAASPWLSIAIWWSVWCTTRYIQPSLISMLSVRQIRSHHNTRKYWYCPLCQTKCCQTNSQWMRLNMHTDWIKNINCNFGLCKDLGWQTGKVCDTLAILVFL